MSDAGWGYGRPAEQDTGVLQVLQAFATQGGQLYGARRWADNPLTLTHVRWLSPANVVLDGFRPPDDDQSPPEEREVWIQLALAFPATHPSPAGPQAPWLPLNVAPAQAGAWAQMLSQALSARRYASQVRSLPQNQSYPQGNPQYYPTDVARDVARSPWRVPGSVSPAPDGSRVSGAPPRQAMGAMDRVERPSAAPAAPFSAQAAEGYVPGQAMPVPHAPAQPTPWNAQAWDSARSEMPEIALLPCIEIEMPPLMPAGGPAGRREFARDASRVFVRALRPLPQVRELRGWLRGERLVLAARYIAAFGGRAATSAEMENTTRHVADALARHTLPYAWLGFAEPGEWTQGAALPE